MSSAKKVERYRSFAVGSVRSWQCRSPKESFKPNHVTTNTLHEFGWPYRNPAPTYQQKLRNSHVKHKGLSRWCSQRFQPEIWLACTMNCGVISFSVLSSKAETFQSNSVFLTPSCHPGSIFFKKKPTKSIHNNLFKKNVWWCLINKSLCRFQKWYNKTKPLRHTTFTNVYIWAPKTYMFRGFLW